MTELIDLTLTLGSERVSLVPGLVGVETESIQTHATHARSNQKLCLATHIGTHVDAPFHFVDGATTIEDMPLEKYSGPALLLDLRTVAKGQSPLSVSELTDAGANLESVKGKIAILFTGWAETESGGPRFYGHGPYHRWRRLLGRVRRQRRGRRFSHRQAPGLATIHHQRLPSPPAVAGTEYPAHREPDQPG